MNELQEKIPLWLRDACGPLLVPFTIRALRAAAGKVNTVDQAVGLAFHFRCCRIRIIPSQIPAEISQLLQVLLERPPRRLLEIGTLGGGTFFLLSRVAAEDALLISADLPAGLFGGGHPEWRGRLIQSFARANQRVQRLRGDSHSAQTLEQVRGLLEGEPLDFLFIDGDHRYEGVKSDFEMYSPLVAKRGLIGFHDIVPGPESRVGGVPVFWQELKRRYGVREFVADWKQGGYGIGLLEKE